MRKNINNSKNKGKGKARQRTVKQRPQQKMHDHLRLRRSEPLHVVRSEQLGLAPHVIRRVPVGLASLPALQMFAKLHQRWRITSLRVEWNPAVGELVSGQLSVFAMADVDAVHVDPGDLYGWTDSGVPQVTLNVSQKGGFNVPHKLLKGTVNDGWFKTGNTSDPSEAFSCQLWIVQKTPFVTSADAAAVNSIDVFGDFKITWDAEFIYHAPLPHSFYPAAAALSRTVGTTATVSEVLPESLATAEFRQVTRTFHSNVNPNATSSNVETVMLQLQLGTVRSIVHSSGGEWSTFVRTYFGADASGDSPYNNPQNELIFGVDLINNSPDWQEYEWATDALLDESNAKRSDDGTEFWWLNKIVSFAAGVQAIGTRSTELASVWSTLSEIGVLIFSLLGLRDTPSPYAAVAERLAHSIARDAVQVGATEKIKHLSNALQAHGYEDGGLPVWWFIGLAPGYETQGGSPTDADNQTAQITATLLAHNVTVTKWIGEVNGVTVFWPFNTDPPTRASGSSATVRRSFPTRSDAAVRGSVVASFRGPAHLQNSGAGRLLLLLLDPDVAPPTGLDRQNFPLFAPDGTQLGSVDVDSDGFVAVVDFVPIGQQKVATGYVQTMPPMENFLKMESEGDLTPLDPVKLSAASDFSQQWWAVVGGIDGSAGTVTMVADASEVWPNALPDPDLLVVGTATVRIVPYSTVLASASAGPARVAKWQRRGQKALSSQCVPPPEPRTFPGDPIRGRGRLAAERPENPRLLTKDGKH